ncbi:flagellar filament capping protein FliD [Bacillus sp. FJAT-50079]|uniref:flagellar filament capping protein FliD n=1 Tax=Bacillus sp. FJAT-50079 TaxID=2833577 RepID=UPI001BCA59B2|nr:flagellar filament capping protein FliD [Bacillus sp. FJAT-50079]MBS4208348.1 flagellar filament capping protein FliD [Bacillus sp. FJAT-50079]
MRIAGLASGMDIDSIVKNLMMAERMPLDKLKQKKQLLEWKRDDFRSINTLMLNFRDKLSQLKLTANYRARTVTSSNDDRVSATVTSGAAQASYSISQVEQLATAATRVNGGVISKGNNKIDPTKTLASQLGSFEEGASFEWKSGVIQSKTFNSTQTMKLEGKPLEASIKVNGKKYEIATNKEQIGDNEVFIEEDGTLVFSKELPKDSVVKVDYVLENKTANFTYPANAETPLTMWNVGATGLASATIKINGQEIEIGNADENGNAQLGSYGTINLKTGTITFDQDNEEIKEQEVKIEVTYTQNYSTFNINTHTSKGEQNEQFFITDNDTLNSVIRKVNDSDAGVTMFYDSFTDRVTLTRKETGDFNEGNEINVDGDFITKILKFDNEANNETGGTNAKFTINGLETQRNSNTFDMSGVTITLKQTFTESDGTVSLAVANDSNQVFENIKGFVEQYNELIAEIGKKLNEEKHRSYKPLTDDEREDLSEKQQEKWEEMARSGLLKGDPILSSVLSAMRLDMSNPVETQGLFKQLASIGITTTANYLEGGKLEINEAKLKAALEEDPTSVENLFRGNGTGADRGIIHKLYDTVDASMKKIQEKAGRATSTNQQFAIGRELINVGDGIDRFEVKMKMVEARYWKQFTAMEKAIQRANEQSAFLMQQFFNY